MCVAHSQCNSKKEILPSLRTGMKRCRLQKTFRRDGKLIVAKVRCDTWNCVTCRPRLIESWREHASAIFGKLNGDFPLRRVVVARPDWGGFSTHLRRYGTPYLKLKWDAESFVVWMASPELGEFTAERAIELIARDLEEMRGLNRCVSTSRCWALPKKRGSGKSEEVISDRILPHVAVAVAKRFNVPAKVRFELAELVEVQLDTKSLSPSRYRMFIAEIAAVSELVFLKGTDATQSVRELFVNTGNCDSDDSRLPFDGCPDRLCREIRS